MSIQKSFTILVLLLAFVVTLPAVRADESNQATKVTFSQPIQIPGRVLPAGTYWFVLPDDITEHYQVRIFNADHTTLYATVDTIDVQRRETADHTTFTFAVRGSQQPQALVSWFYPDATRGHEFVYPKQVQNELAKDKLATVLAGD